MDKNRFIQACLNWKYLYIIHILGIIIAILFQVDSCPPSPPEKWVIIYWWILGIVTLLITLYHLYSKHWKNGMLIGLLMIFWGLFTCLYL